MSHPVSSFFGDPTESADVVFLGECDANLPSGESAKAFLDGEPGGLASVASHMALRGGLIAFGMAVAGVRGTDLVKGAIGGTIAIEGFVLGWMYLNSKVKL